MKKREDFKRCHLLEERCKRCTGTSDPSNASPVFRERAFTEVTLPVRVSGVEPTKEEKEKEVAEAEEDKATETEDKIVLEKEIQDAKKESDPTVKEEKTSEQQVTAKKESKGKEKVDDNTISEPMAVRYGPPFTIPEDVLENTPEGWKVEESEYFLFLVSNLPWISSDVMSSPYAHFSDGNLDLLVTKKSSNLTRAQSLGIFTKLDTGGHVEAKEIEYSKVKAFTLEPLERDGFISIDGEKTVYAPLIAQVHPGLFRVMCPPPIPKPPQIIPNK